jgi:hypothetical protein
LVRVRYTLGICRIYGREYTSVWTEASDQVLLKVRRANGWEIEGAEEPVLEATVEEVLETVEVVDEEVDLSKLSKKELQALCDEAGLSYKAFDTKSTLISLLSDEEE